MTASPLPYEFITAIDGEDAVYGRFVFAAEDLPALAPKLVGYGLTIRKSTTTPPWGALEVEGPLPAMAQWLPEHEIRRLWYPPLPAGVSFDGAPTKEQFS